MLGHIVSTENFKESVKNPGISGLVTSFFLVQLSNSRGHAGALGAERAGPDRGCGPGVRRKKPFIKKPFPEEKHML